MATNLEIKELSKSNDATNLDATNLEEIEESSCAECASAQDKHPCPYAAEINMCIILCTCCPSCTVDCIDSI